MTSESPLISGSAVRRGGLAVVAFAAAASVVVLVEFIVVGLLPALSRDLEVTLDRAGWTVSAFALSAAIAGPCVTLLAGRIDPKDGLPAALAIYGGAGVVAAMMPDFWVLLAVRIVQGAILTYFISVASHAAMALTTPDRAARAVGQVNIGTILGAIAASPLGLWGADVIGWDRLYACLGGLALVAAVVTWGRLPRGLLLASSTMMGQAAILRSRQMLLHLALSLTLFAAMFASYGYVAVILFDALQVTAADAALILIGFGVSGLIGNAIASAMADRDSDRTTALVAAALFAIGLMLPVLGWHWMLDVPIIAVWGAAHAAAFVACQVRVMLQAPEAAAFAGSLNISVCNVGIGIGAPIGGWVLAGGGPQWLGTAMAGIAALALVLFLVSLRFRA
jgi:predicted MFS family arabinose efflux permease